MVELRDRVPETIVRGTFASGERRDPPGTTIPSELRVSLERPDPTGETAIKEPVADVVGAAIERMCKHIFEALAIAKWVMDDVPRTTEEAVKREIPDCAACDEPIFGRVKSGYCQPCYDRRRYLGVADRAEFRRIRLVEVAALKDGQE